MPITYLKYRGAVYRKAEEVPEDAGGKPLDEKLLLPAWNGLRPKVKELESQFKEKILDKVVEDANKVLYAETLKFNKDAGKTLFDALLAELTAGAGGMDLASKKKVYSMLSALWHASKQGIISPSVLTLLFGWSPPKLEKIKYRDMEKYFDPDQPEGKAYLHQIITRLKPLLEEAAAARASEPSATKPSRPPPPKPPKPPSGRQPLKKH